MTRTSTAATAAERKVVADLLDLMNQAYGDTPALREVRGLIGAQLESTLAGLRSWGVDTDALLDELDPEDV